MSSNTAAQVHSPMWRSLAGGALFVLTWAFMLLEEMDEKEAAWHNDYPGTTVLWRRAEWVIWLASIGGVCAEWIAIPATLLAASTWLSSGPTNEWLYQELWWVAKTGAGIYLACLVVALVARLVLALQRGCDEDTPEDFVHNTPAPNLHPGYTHIMRLPTVCGWAIAYATSVVVVVYTSDARFVHYLWALPGALVAGVIITIIIEDSRNGRKHSVPHTRGAYNPEDK